MKKRIIVVVSAGILVLGLLSSLSYMKSIILWGNGNALSTTDNLIMESRLYSNIGRVAQDNGFTRGAQYTEDWSYEAMKNYMNSVSSEEYDRMMNIMRQNGYEDMVNVMQSIKSGAI